MKTLFSVVTLALALIAAPASAADEKKAAAKPTDCEAKAVSKDGKKLTGAAKDASIKKCEADLKAAK